MSPFKGKFTGFKNQVIIVIEFLFDGLFAILFFLFANSLIYRLPIERWKVGDWFFFDYVLNQKIQRLQLLKWSWQAGNPTPRKFRIWWARSKSNNFGDNLTPYLLTHIANLDCAFDRNRPAVGIGSIVRFARDYSYVWGSGIIRSNETIPTRPTCLSVRGPLTREKVLQAGGKCPEIYGDPAMLLPLFYKPKLLPNRHPVTIAPHYKHSFLARKTVQHNYVDVVARNVRAIENVIDQIANSDKVITSSLHVFILCVAYGVPVALFRLEEKSIGGDDIKFKDFCLGVNAKPVEMVSVREFSKTVIAGLIRGAKRVPHTWDPKPTLESLNSYLQSDYLTRFMAKTQ